VRSLRELALDGKRVFLRADLNVPLDGGRVADPTRIEATLPSLRFILEHGGRAVVASHLGRPKGAPRPELSLRPVADVLGRALGLPVALAPDCIGDETEQLANALGRGQVLLLENLRFHPEEEKNDPGFSRALARLGDVYVDDAFGAVHRAHASTVGMTRHFRERGAGFLLEREVQFLSRLLHSPEPGDTLIAEVIQAVSRAGGLDYARERALQLAQQADTELDLLQPSAAREALRASITYVIDRRS